MENIQDLEKISIYQLREIARNLGVNSPTTLTKAKLIEEMSAIMSGKKTPYKPAVRHGRPPKKIAAVDNVIKILPNEQDVEVEYGYKPGITNSTIKFAQEMYAYDSNVSPQRFRLKGYLEILNNGRGYIRQCEYTSSSMKYVVSEELINKYNLKYGDLIECEAEKYMDEQPCLIKDLLTINNTPIMRYDRNRVDFGELKAEGLSQQLMFKHNEQPICQAIKRMPIYCGSSVAVVGNSLQDISPHLVDIVDNLQSVFGSKIIYLNNAQRNISPVFNNEKVVKFTAPISASFEEQKRVAILAWGHANVCAGMGEKVVFVVDNLNSVATCSATPDGDIPIAKLIMGSAKNTSFGSITVITGFSMPPETPVANAVANIYYDNVDVLYMLNKQGDEVNLKASRYSLLPSIPPVEAEQIKQDLNKK
ncbi:MAG: hypothetical protein J6C90_02125 [Clostridia bacterium]|nr:hypothetical protein [Clostridia bacterium]